MAENESAHFPEHCNHLTRRAALASTAALSAAVLPVGAAVAAAAPDDPGLAVIEAGYREWQGVLAEADRLDDLEGEYRGRAWDRVPPAALPEPEPTPEIAKLWHGPSGLIEEARDPGS